MAETKIRKIKDWLVNGKPQFKVLESNKKGATKVLRLKDNVVFSHMQAIGHIRIVAFMENLIDVSLFVREAEAKKQEFSNKKLPEQFVTFQAPGDIPLFEIESEIQTVEIRLRKAEINDIEILEDINKPGWKECNVKLKK